MTQRDIEGKEKMEDVKEDIKRLRNIWNSMKYRCENPNCEAARYYHNRGIRVCDEWKNSFSSFSSWALENGYEKGLTIDRINPDGNYCPENCRWITKAANSARVRHTKNGHRIAVDLGSEQKPKAKNTKATRCEKKQAPHRFGCMPKRRAEFKYNFYWWENHETVWMDEAIQKEMNKMSNAVTMMTEDDAVEAIEMGRFIQIFNCLDKAQKNAVMSYMAGMVIEEKIHKKEGD